MLSIVVLSARQPDQTFLSGLNAALDASGLAQKVLTSNALTALADDSGRGLTLLIGCEDAGLEFEASDAAIRRALTQSGAAYQVLYGDVNERLSQALRLIETKLQQASSQPAESAAERDRSSPAWVWLCDKCSDPQCEHKLLTDLLANRPQKAAAHSTED